MLELYKKSRAVLSAFLGLTVIAAGVGFAPAAYAADSDVSVVVQELSSDRGLQVLEDEESPLGIGSGVSDSSSAASDEDSDSVSSSESDSSVPEVKLGRDVKSEPSVEYTPKAALQETVGDPRDIYIEYRDTGALPKGAGDFVDYDPAKGIPEIRDEGVFLWTLYRDIVSSAGTTQTTSPVAKIIIRNDYTAPLVYVLKSGNYLRLVSTDMLSGVDKLQIDDRILKYRDDTATWNSINGKNKSWTLVSVEGGTVSEREAAKANGVPAGEIGLIFTFQKTADHPVKVSDVATNLTHFTVSIDGTGGDDPGPTPPPDSSDSDSSSKDDGGNGGSDISGSADPGPDDSKDDGWPDPGSSDSGNSGGSDSNSGGSGGNSGGNSGGGTQEFPGFSGEVTIKDSGTVTVDPDGSYHGSGGDNNWKGYRPKDDDDENGNGNSNDRDPSTNGDIDWPGDQGSGGNGNGSGNGTGNGGAGNGDGSGNGNGNGNGSGDGSGNGDLISGWNTPGDPDYIIDTGNSNGNANGGNSGGAMGDIGGALNGNVQTGNAGGHHVSCRSLDCDGSCLQKHLYRCVDSDCKGTCKMIAAVDVIATVLGLIAILGLMFLTAIGKIRVPAVVFIVVSIVWGLASAAGALALFRYSREIALACVCGMLFAVILSILLTFKNRSKGPKLNNHSNSRKQSGLHRDSDDALDVEYSELKGSSSAATSRADSDHDEYDWNDSED